MLETSNFSSPYPIVINTDLKQVVNELGQFIEGDNLFIIVDQNTKKYCWPLLEEFFSDKFNSILITMEMGENNKNILAVEKIWNCLYDHFADRNAYVLNIGGGIVGDIGSFAASTFMRGVHYINIPTSLLAMVDASIGSKNGFNFRNIKNGIGLFSDPKKVIVNTRFLETLPQEEILSGYGEVLKYALIDDESFWTMLSGIKLNVIDWDLVVSRSLHIKDRIVSTDRLEENVRKKLNFGHTIGHALEMFYLNENRELKHGFAVAAGMICESYISSKVVKLSIDHLDQITKIISNLYPKVNFEIGDIKEIRSLTGHDKKNINNRNQFTLIDYIGNSVINQFVEDDLISESLEYYLSIYN